MAWETFVMPFGKHRGTKMGDIADVDPGYIVWMSENLSDGNVKKIALEAIKALTGGMVAQRSSKGAIEYVKIKLLREVPAIWLPILKESVTYPFGILAIQVSGLESTRKFDELSEYCRLWDVEGEFWRVPLPLLGDMLLRFPDARLYGELKEIVEWTPPEPLERGYIIPEMNKTPLPDQVKKEKKKSELNWEHLKDIKMEEPGNYHYEEHAGGKKKKS